MILWQKCDDAFCQPFGDNPQFPFKFLQSAGTGAKALIVPATSDNYHWKAKQVATMGGTRGIYIWAQKPVEAKDPQVRVSCRNCIGLLILW